MWKTLLEKVLEVDTLTAFTLYVVEPLNCQSLEGYGSLAAKWDQYGKTLDGWHGCGGTKSLFL